MYVMYKYVCEVYVHVCMYLKVCMSAILGVLELDDFNRNVNAIDTLLLLESFVQVLIV